MFSSSELCSSLRGKHARPHVTHSYKEVKSSVGWDSWQTTQAGFELGVSQVWISALKQIASCYLHFVGEKTKAYAI